MIIPEKIDNCPVCEPIKNLLIFLTDKGFTIKEQRCSDYHFRELYFKLLPPSVNMPNENLIVQGIDKIKKHEDGFYFCDCHLSVVEIENNRNDDLV